MGNAADLVHVYDSQTGTFVNEKHRRVAEIVQDYDPTLFLVWIPPAQRTEAKDREFPFAILHKPLNRPEYIVRTVKESEVDERLLAWLWSNDAERTNPLAMLEKEEAARQAMELHARQEERDEAIEIGTAILNSPLNTYRHNGKVYK